MEVAMAVALNRIEDRATRVVDLRGACYAHRISGELVWALLAEDGYLVIDEYGAFWEQDARSFMVAYEPSQICPLS
jgi:hypothetical protein